jgi:hypothetical protein
MNRKIKTDLLFEHFRKGSYLEYCPFLYSWFEPKLEEISNMPKHPSREGINPEDPKPMPRHKIMMALFQFVYPKLSLKKYAETYDLSYGTIRNWNVDKQYNEFQSELEREYLGLFINNLKSLIESENIKAANQLLDEVGHYQNPLLIIWIQRELIVIRDNIFKQLESKERLPEPSDLLYESALTRFMYSTLSKGIFKDYDELRKWR